MSTVADADDLDAALAHAQATQPASTVDLARAEQFARHVAGRWPAQRWSDTSKSFVEIVAEIDRLRSRGDELAAAVVELTLAREDPSLLRSERDRAVETAERRLHVAAREWRLGRGGEVG